MAKDKKIIKAENKKEQKASAAINAASVNLSKELDYKTTKDIKIPEKIIDQVIGQDSASEVIKKASLQRRHVLLIGEPGTGKSMLGLALAELLPKENLVDILSFPNPNDENQPLIRTVKAGQGRDIILRARLESANVFKNQNMIMLVLVLIAMFSPWWVRSYYKSDIMFAAFFLGGMIFLGAFVIFINLGQKMNNKKILVPKIIVDNYNKKQSSFLDATGAHAGALLGDVLHDPFQCFFPTTKLTSIENNIRKNAEMSNKIDNIIFKNKDNVLKKTDSNYQAIFLPKNELVVLGETQGSVSPVEVLSSNKQKYDGEMIKLTTSENKEIIITPEHKIASWQNGKIVYVEAQNIQEGDEVAAKAEDIIIDEQDIINTYSKEQQALAKSYYDSLELKKQNPSWGYKKIASALGVSYGRTRWWHDHQTMPVPLQTVEWLKKRGLLPLKTDNPELPLIAKVLGATFGDGGIFENLNGIFLSSSELEATKEFGEDLVKIFDNEVDKNKRTIEGGIEGHSWCYQNTNRNMIRFFIALGAPKGNKSKTNLEIPQWIYLSENLADEFFGSFFGAELGAPKLHKQKNRLQTLDLAITGTLEFEQNRLDFLNRIKQYLEHKGIVSTSLLKRTTKTEGVYLYRLLLSIQFDNVVRFIKNVKINYCIHKKEKILKAINDFSQIKKQKYSELLQRGYGAERAMGLLNLTPRSLYFVLNDEAIEQWH